MTALQVIVNTYPPAPQLKWWLINAWLNPFYPWPRNLLLWWRRVGAAIKVMRLQHAIHERVHGFEFARIKATRSAILFGAPRFMQGLLARWFKPGMERAYTNATRKTPEPEEATATA